MKSVAVGTTISKLEYIFFNSLLIVCALDVWTQYTNFAYIGLRLNLILVTMIMIISPYFISKKIKREDVFFLILIVLLLVGNYNNYSYNFVDYIKICTYTVLYILFFIILMSSGEKLLSYKITMLIFVLSIANVFIREYLSVAGIVPNYNYNWSTYIVLILYIILFKNSKYFKYGILPIAITAILIGSRGVFIGSLLFFISLTVFSPKSTFEKSFTVRYVPHFFALGTILLPLFIIFFVHQFIDERGYLSLNILGKGGMSGRELGYFLYFDYLTSIKSIWSTLLLGAGAQSYAITSDYQSHVDEYTHIYSAGLHWILFCGVPVTYLFFLRVGKFLVINAQNSPMAIGLCLMSIVFGIVYSILSMMHITLAFLLLFSVYSPIKGKDQGTANA